MQILKRPLGLLAAALLLGAAGLLSGCEDHEFTHSPPARQGSIIVDNHSRDVLHVYLGGYYTNDVGDHEYEAYDCNPGLYRVALYQKCSSNCRFANNEVDVLEGQLAILKVRIDEASREYNISLYYE